MHSWNDKWFEKYGDDLYKAQRYVTSQVKKYSACHLMSKEKFGTIRYEWIFPPGGGLFYRHWYSRFWIESRLYDLWRNYGWYITKRAVYSAIKKYPHLKDELLSDLASNEGLVGAEVYNRYWKRCK